MISRMIALEQIQMYLNFLRNTFSARVNVHLSRVVHCASIYIYVKSTVMASANSINTLRPRQDGRHFLDNTFKYISLIENA